MALERLTKLLLAGSESPPDKDDSIENLTDEFQPKQVCTSFGSGCAEAFRDKDTFAHNSIRH